MYYGVLRQKDNWGLLAASLLLCSMRDHVPKNTVDRNLMICLHTTTHICAYTHTHTHTLKHAHSTHMHKHLCTHMHMSTHSCPHTCHTHTHIVHTCMHKHTCVQTHTQILKNFLREQGSSFISVFFLHFW